MHLFFCAGEISGDTHGSGVMRELREANPDVRFSGLGGPRMREVGGAEVEDWVETAGVVGLWEVLKMYSYFKQKLAATTELVLKQGPDAVVLVDYPGFNLRLAAALRDAGYRGKLIYYISPQVWAWKKGRVKTMAELLDLMICIFPFEKELYEKSGLRTEFAGHPLVDRTLSLRREWKREPRLIGWFPGSRSNEVRRLFPVMLEASRAIRLAVPDVQFAISAANERLAGEMRVLADAAQMPEARRWIEVGTVYDLMQRSGVAAVASGTATLEAACFGLPYSLVYKVSGLTYWIGKMVVRIKNLGIVNILAQRQVVRELVQADLTPDTLAAEMVDLLQNDERRHALEAELAEVVSMLGEGGAYVRTAKVIEDCVLGS
ncbi:MAG: lipid-A-disaccharide synthase [Verrucomicrobiaceae bacterium]|nr:lipid-A-disaccharide synthase [Verrucomicrobiaceae bacterium]